MNISDEEITTVVYHKRKDRNIFQSLIFIEYLVELH